MMPVAAGGLNYDGVKNAVGTYVGLHDLGQWNVRKVAADPIAAADAAAIARQVLKSRLEQISRYRPPGEPLRLVLNTRKKPAFEPGVALSLDWTHRFDGRLVIQPDAWKDHLLPALETVAQHCERQAPGRRIIAEGLCALPDAVALGSAFLATRRIPIAWRQISQKRPPELWSLTESPAPSGFSAQILPGTTSADDRSATGKGRYATTRQYICSSPSRPVLRL